MYLVVFAACPLIKTSSEIFLSTSKIYPPTALINRIFNPFLSDLIDSLAVLNIAGNGDAFAFVIGMFEYEFVYDIGLKVVTPPVVETGSFD